MLYYAASYLADQLADLLGGSLAGPHASLGGRLTLSTSRAYAQSPYKDYP